MAVIVKSTQRHDAGTTRRAAPGCEKMAVAETTKAPCGAFIGKGSIILNPERRSVF